MTKKPEEVEVNFSEVEIDGETFKEEDIKKAEEIIRNQVANSKPYTKSSNSVTTPIAKDRPDVDVRKVKEEKDAFIQNDDLVRLVRSGANSFNLLDKVIEEAAIDTANLKFNIEHNDRYQLDATKTIKARTQTLKLISDLIISKKELARDTTINLKSKKLLAVFDYFFQVIQTSLAQTEGVTIEQRELFGSILQKNLENFENEADKIIKKIEDE